MRKHKNFWDRNAGRYGRGMIVYKDAELEQAGFPDEQRHKKKDWLRATARKG